MSRSLYMLSLICFIVMAFSSYAFARYEESLSPINFKIGLYQPTDSTLRGEDSMWRSISIGYNLQTDRLSRGTAVASIERMASRKGRLNHHIMGLNYTRIWYQNPTELQGFYYGGGGGIYAVKAHLYPTYYEEFPPHEGSNRSGVSIGLNAVGGYDISSNFFAELRYKAMSSLGKDANLSGLTLYIGTKQFF